MMALLVLGGTTAATAQSTADAYFHEAARQYVADEVQAARRTVERGLEVAPSDSRLLALRKKLKQGKRPDNPGGRQDSSKTGSNVESQQNNDSSSEESSKGGEEPSEEQSGAKQSGSPESPSSEQTGPPSSTSPSGDGAGRPGAMRQGQGGRPVDTLSRAQAERLLRALEGQERPLLRRLRPQSTKRRSVEKDW
jgi:hypothetical protein